MKYLRKMATGRLLSKAMIGQWQDSLCSNSPQSSATAMALRNTVSCTKYQRLPSKGHAQSWICH